MADCYWVVKEDRYIQCTRCHDILPCTDTSIRRNCPRAGLGDWVEHAMSRLGFQKCPECQERKEALDRLDGAVRELVSLKPVSRET